MFKEGLWFNDIQLYFFSLPISVYLSMKMEIVIFPSRDSVNSLLDMNLLHTAIPFSLHNYLKNDKPMAGFA